MPSATIDVYVQPRASRTEVVGMHGDALKIRVKAPPVDGAANAELLRFLAKQLGVSRSAMVLARGDSSRSKQLTVDGLTTRQALTRLIDS